MPGSRTIPRWVITDRYEDEELGVLKAGKEAGCFLVRRTSEDRFCLLVRKDYRKRSDRTYDAPVRAGERGLRRDRYEPAMAVLDARDRRAIRKRTAHGWEALEGLLAVREFETLERLWNAGARVPYPVELAEHGFLMQYIGNGSAAAPRLSDARITRAEAGQVFDRVVEQMRIFAVEGIVHADLSAYNILLQHGHPWIIDVPQAVDLYTYADGRALFERDVENVCRFFERNGVTCDRAQLIEDLLAL